MPTEQSRRRFVLLAAVLLGAVIAVGCSASPPDDPVAPALPAEPPAVDLSEPRRAVESYLAWISYAYRVGESDVASHTMSAEEGVRVDSYVQLNKEQGRVIEQVLVGFAPAVPSVEGTHALLAAREQWKYRYLYPGRREATPIRSASYDTTYTVVEVEPGVWVVDAVQVRPLAAVE